MLYTGNLHSALIDTFDKFLAPEFAFSFMDGILYFHDIIFSHAAQYLVRYFPRVSWWVTSCFGGFDKQYHVDINRIPMMANNDLGGTSAKNVMHWSQMIRSGNLSFFDFGPEGN